jgi:hypothetical protein
MWIALIEGLAGIDKSFVRKTPTGCLWGRSEGTSASGYAMSLEELGLASRSLNAQNLLISHF